jgi:hypothetical protein
MFVCPRLRPSIYSLVLAALFVLAGTVAKGAEPAAKSADKIKEIAGKSEFLRSVPKHFARLIAVDPAQGRVTLLIDGESLAKVWSLTPDAEVKLAGWWGRLDQLTVDDRVWVWFQTNRAKQPVAVSMICDELSEQDIHGPGVEVVSTDPASVTIKPVKGANRTLKAAGAEVFRGKQKMVHEGLAAASKIYVQSRADRARLILDPEAFEARRAEQKAALRQRWIDKGLPGTVTFLHQFTGELEFMLDHEAMRWGRALKPGDAVTIQTATPIKAVVKFARPWREHTRLQLVTAAADQGDLSLGQRVGLLVPAPPADIENALLPPDLDQARSKAERVDWFLASIYCTCKVKGDGCTGHFYTLASCNPNACGMPNHMRKAVAEKIDQGLTDRQIFEELLKEHGPILLKPHLLP